MLALPSSLLISDLSEAHSKHYGNTLHIYPSMESSLDVTPKNPGGTWIVSGQKDEAKSQKVNAGLGC